MGTTSVLRTTNTELLQNDSRQRGRTPRRGRAQKRFPNITHEATASFLVGLITASTGGCASYSYTYSPPFQSFYRRHTIKNGVLRESYQRRPSRCSKKDGLLRRLFLSSLSLLIDIMLNLARLNIYGLLRTRGD